VSLADALALLRALAVLPIWFALLTDQRMLALAIFIIAAITDVLDGWAARRHTLSAHGALVDPLADKALVVGTLLALTLVGSGWPVTLVTVFAAIREGIVAIVRVRAHRRGITLTADRIGKLKTAAELVGVALILVGGRPWSVLGAGLVGCAVAVGVLTLPRYFAKRLA
jgi:CDP-diacylglycerol---glycerol-3-phosphate 3-phosphatidyltransferase